MTPEIVKNDLIHNMTPENRSKTFQNWSKATLSTSTSKETIESKEHIQRENNRNKRQNLDMFTAVGYREKSDLLITQKVLQSG